MQTPSTCFKLALVTALAATAALPATAQTLTSGATPTVVYAGGNDLVVKSTDGKLLNYTIPAGYKFSAGDKQLSLAELKPGTKLSKAVSPGSDPKPISSVAVAKGKIYAVTPPDGVTLSLTEGTKDLTVPAGTTFMVDGKKMTMAELKPNMMVEATIVTTAADGAPAEAAPSTPPMVGALLVAHTLGAGEADLPAAGTHLPLYGALGAGFLVLGLALMTFRRPAAQI
jgi:hypothetical protein